MNTQRYDDETLMAFADGELDAVTAERLERDLTRDPDLAARVAIFAETRQLARDAFPPSLDEPVPVSLMASVEAAIVRAEGKEHPQTTSEQARVIPFRPRLQPVAPPAANQNRRPPPRLAMPVAASIAILAAGAIGYLAGAGLTGPRSESVALIEAPGLQEALSETASGGEVQLADSGTFRPVSSFRDPNERLCREFELMGAGGGYIGVACRGEDSWNLAFALSQPGAQDGGYSPASSLETLDSYLTSIEAGPPLSATDEAAALNALE